MSDVKYKMRHPHYPGHEGWEIWVDGSKVGEVWKFQNMLGKFWVAKSEQGEEFHVGKLRETATTKMLKERDAKLD